MLSGIIFSSFGIMYSVHLIQTSSFSLKKLMYLLLLLILIWGGYLQKRTAILDKAEIFLKTFELDSFYGKQNCLLTIDNNFMFYVECDSEVKKRGKWDLHNGDSPILLLDGEIFGFGEYKIIPTGTDF